MTSNLTFRTSLVLVLDEIKNIKELHRLARTSTKLIRFAIDVCLVTHGVRSVPLDIFCRVLMEIDSTGYLVDTVFPPNPEQSFTILLKALREKVRWWRFILTVCARYGNNQRYGRAQYSNMSCGGITPLQGSRSWSTLPSWRRSSPPCSVGPGSVSLLDLIIAYRW